MTTELTKTITDPGISKSINDFYEQTAIPADSFARAVVYPVSQPEDVDINEVLYRQTSQLL